MTNKNNETLTSFINKLSQNSSDAKAICHYKNIKSMINFYNCMNAYKNLTGSENLLIPNVNINNNSILLSFNQSESIDLPKFNECIKKYCPNLFVNQDVKSTSITIKT